MAAEGALTARQVAIVAAVRAAVGTRFRPLGRRVGVGLDCVGVALIAAAAAGNALRTEPYVLGGDHDGKIEPVLRAVGCQPVARAAPGDLLLVAPTLRQRHLAVATPAGIVHAHAGLGRVVEGPLDPDWIVLGAWRLPGVN